MNAAPQLPGYQLDQRMLGHPLAEIWRGRSFTGMRIVALVLTEAGAADPQVRERLGRLSRVAALQPGEWETPLWAANLTADLPYAITQLVPGESGAERLLDPLDGVLGDDQESLIAVRAQLTQYGAAPVPTIGPASEVEGVSGADEASRSRIGTHSQAEPAGRTGLEAGSATTGLLGLAEEYRRKLGAWTYLLVSIGVVGVFTVTYSIGGAIGSVVKDPGQETTQSSASAAVSPGPLPSPALLPGIARARPVTYKPAAAQVSLVGATYRRGADVQVVDELDLPFAFGWPRPPFSIDLGESSYSIYRRVLTGENPATASMDARIAVHPCPGLAACLAQRAAFDRHWTAYFKADVPKTPRGARTWIAVRPAGRKPYALTMTHAFRSGNRWWLAGVLVTGQPGEEAAVQRVLNDIRSQTP